MGIRDAVQAHYDLIMEGVMPTTDRVQMQGKANVCPGTDPTNLNR
jgi:hypothetical protein